MAGGQDANWEEMVLVGRIGRPHGIRGHVFVSPETDFVEERFAPGATVWIRSARGAEALTVAAARLQGSRPVVAFEGFPTIEAVEPLVGQELRVRLDVLQPLASGVYYQHELIGCVVDTVEGERVGTVVRVDGGAGGSLLVVDGTRGEVLIPLAVDICISVDVAAKRIAIQAPEGLLDLNAR